MMKVNYDYDEELVVVESEDYVWEFTKDEAHLVFLALRELEDIALDFENAINVNLEFELDESCS